MASQKLPVSLPEPIYSKLQQEKKRTGVNLAEIIRRLLKKRYNLK